MVAVQANEVLRSMKSAGVSPNVHTYTSLLKGAARTGDLDQMMEIFQAMIVQVRQDTLFAKTEGGMHD
jgi:pentatricopeptide repeat protein